MAKKKTDQKFRTELKEKNPNIEAITFYINDCTKIKVKCLVCKHEWWATPNNLLHGKGCPECSKKRVANKRRTTLEKMLEKLKEVWGKLIIYVGGFSDMRHKCAWKCTIDNHIWFASPDSILRGTGCPICGRNKSIKNRTTPLYEILQKIQKIFNGMIIYISGYINTHKKCKWKCLICGYEWEAPPKALLQGHGCKKCALEYTASLKRTTEQEYANAVYINSDKKISYISGFITTASLCKHKCNICGNEWDALAGNILYSKTGCPFCSKKSMEKPVYNILKEKNVLFKYDKALEGCYYESTRPLRADFRLENYPLIIETDGRQHHILTYGNEKDFIKLQERDAYKNKWCKKHKYILIRVTSSVNHEWGTEKHITLSELLHLIEIGVDGNGNVNLDVFRPYDFNKVA